MGGVIVFFFLVILGLLVKQVFPIWYASYWASFLLGDYMANASFEKKLTTDKIFGLSVIVLVSCWCIYPLESTQIGKIANIIFSFIIGLISCIVFFNFFKKVKLPKFLNIYFTEMGKYTLPLYLIPILIIPHGVTLNTEYLSATMLNLLIICAAIIHSIVSYTLGRIIYELPYLRFILFGKK